MDWTHLLPKNKEAWGFFLLVYALLLQSKYMMFNPGFFFKYGK